MEHKTYPDTFTVDDAYDLIESEDQAHPLWDLAWNLIESVVESQSCTGLASVQSWER